MNKNAIKLLLVALVLIVVLVKNPYKLIIVSGDSMFPTYKHNQILLAKKTNEFKKFDVVVLNVESDLLIKRIIYTEGDHIYFYFDNNDNKVFLNDSYEVINDFINNHKDKFLFEYPVPKQNYFVMGDNRNHSDDSRRFGNVNQNEILYKVID